MVERTQRPAQSGGAAGTIAAVAVLAAAQASLWREPPSATSTTDRAAAPDAAPEPAPPTGILGAIDRFQRRRRPLAFIVGVIRKSGDDQAGRLAAVIAYYGFFSLFPLLLALVTVLGFVLEDRPDLRDDISESALGQFPVIGDAIGDAVSSPLTGSHLALTVGVLGALWAGMGAMQAAQDALNTAWDVPRDQYPNFFVKRLRSLLLLGTLGVMLIATAAAPQLVDQFVGGSVGKIALLGVSVIVDITVFWVAFRVMTVADVPWRQHLPGAIVAGVGYALLQLVGSLYVTRVLNGASNTYGTFATVIGLLSWIFLLAQMTMYAAEVNVVAARRLWPRSLTGPPRPPSEERPTS